jgi:hypothetical protein
MRPIVAVILAAIAIGLYAPALSAAPASSAAPQSATPITRIGWGWDWYYGGYRPACPWGYHYACQVGPYGYRRCACWPNW